MKYKDGESVGVVPGTSGHGYHATQSVSALMPVYLDEGVSPWRGMATDMDRRIADQLTKGVRQQ